MIEVRLPKEIRTYKETFIFGMTLRQTICMVIALLINVPTYFFLSEKVGDDLSSWLVLFTAAPLVLIGWFKYNGMETEKVAACIARFLFTSQKYHYGSENFFHWIWEECQKQEEEE
ncbi:MAG: PrgI family protein [Eubacteriales bacterium]|nr:PrgI family protein [Eubacteriales bacterium]MDD3350013.1 PrgI family protein [Eubacteriales bacterium]